MQEVFKNVYLILNWCFWQYTQLAYKSEWVWWYIFEQSTQMGPLQILNSVQITRSSLWSLQLQVLRHMWIWKGTSRSIIYYIGILKISVPSILLYNEGPFLFKSKKTSSLSFVGIV